MPSTSHPAPREPQPDGPVGPTRDGTSPRLPAVFALWIGIVVLALLARLVVIGLFDHLLTEDRDAYLSLARGLAAGRGYVQPDGRTPTAFRPPLYPLVLAPALRTFPESTGVALLNLAAGLATILAVLSLVGSQKKGAGVLWSPLVAGGIVAIDPLLLHNTALPMTEVLAAALMAIWLRQVVANRVESPHPAVRGPLIEGVLWGIGALCRPVFLPLGMLVACWPTPAERHGHWRHWRIRAVWSVCGAALVLTPWVVRNAVLFGRPIATTTHGGYTLLLGHNPVYYREIVNGPPGAVWDGRSLEAWQRSLEEELAAAGIPPSDETARDAWFGATARKIVFDDPWMAVRSGMTLMGRFWSVAPSDVAARPLPRVVVWGIAAGNVVVFTLAGIGLVVCLRTRNPLGETALIALLVFSAVHFVYWSDQRMRAPLVPVLACLAATGFVSAMRWSRGRDAARSGAANAE
jgi:hypothetical protein